MYSINQDKVLQVRKEVHNILIIQIIIALGMAYMSFSVSTSLRPSRMSLVPGCMGILMLFMAGILCSNVAILYLEPHLECFRLASDRKGKYSKNPYNSVVEFQEAMANNDPCVEGVRLIAIAIVCRQILDDLGAISRYAESLIFFLGIFVSAYTQVFSPVLVAGIIVIVMFEINAASAGIADNLIECNSEQKD